MDQPSNAKRNEAEFLLDQADLAHTYLDTAERFRANPLMGFEYLASAQRVLGNVEAFLALGRMPPELRAQLLAARSKLWERLTLFV